MKKTCLLIALCIVFSLFGCSCASSNIKFKDSTIVESLNSWNPLMSYWGGLIHCGLDETEDDYVFEIHARHGSFYVQPNIDEPHLCVTDLIIEGSGDVYWWANSVSYPTLPNRSWKGIKTFLEVFIKKNGQYVGYAVVAIERTEDLYYDPTVVECKEVLQQENSANELSREELQEIIDNVINIDFHYFKIYASI